MAQERGDPLRPAAGDQTRPHAAAAENRPRVPDTRGPAGHLHGQPHACRGMGQAIYRLCSWMMHSRLEPMKELARLIRRHFAEIIAYFEHPYTNAVLEGVNSVLQNVKRRARGFRNMDYFATIIYLTCGKLDLKPSPPPHHHPPQTANNRIYYTCPPTSVQA